MCAGCTKYLGAGVIRIECHACSERSSAVKDRTFNLGLGKTNCTLKMRFFFHKESTKRSQEEKCKSQRAFVFGRSQKVYLMRRGTVNVKKLVSVLSNSVMQHYIDA